MLADRNLQDTPDGRIWDSLHQVYTLLIETFVIFKHLLDRSILCPWSSLAMDLLMLWAVKRRVR